MEGKFDKRARPQREREIYRPGSGPLRRTDPADSKGFVYKYDHAGRSDHSRNGKDDYDADKMAHDSGSYNRYDHYNDNKSLDKDRKKTRKPDASIYVPKQRNRADPANAESHNYNSFQSDNPKPSYSSREGLMSRENEPSANPTHYDNQHQSRTFIETKQFTRGYKNDNQSNWKEYSKENSDFKRFDSNRDPYESHQPNKGGYKNNPPHNDEKNTFYNSEHKASSNYNRYGNEPFNDKYRNDRGNANDKGRMGRSLSRRNSSNNIVLPDTFSAWAPRLQRQYLENKGIKPEDLDKYLKSKQQQQQFVGNTNRDNRYSQTLPPKNNRNSHFKMGNNKENPRSRFFQKPKPFDDRPGTDHSCSSDDKFKPSNIGSSELTTSTEKSWNSNESAQDIVDTKSDSGKKDNTEDEPTEESNDPKSDLKDIDDTNDEDFVIIFFRLDIISSHPFYIN